ncbi:hypothetical protein ACTFIU_001737 [Dictyostelium citrinum]
MNEAEIEKILLKLNKINQVLEERIFNLYDEIENQIKLIQNNKAHLQTTTQDIVNNETHSEEMIKQIDLINVEIAKIESQINDLNKQITENELEIENYNQQIRDQEPTEDFWEAGIFFNPIASFKELVNALGNNIKECNEKISNFRNEINKENQIKEQKTIKKNDCVNSKLEIDKTIQQLQIQRIELEKKLKELGIKKTNNENFKLELQSIKSQCILLIESTNQGKDLLDIGINLVDEIEDKIKTLFTTNGLQPFNFLILK